MDRFCLLLHGPYVGLTQFLQVHKLFYIGSVLVRVICVLFFHKHERNALACSLTEHWEKFGEAGIFPPDWTGGVAWILSLLSLAVDLPFVLACGK